MLMPQFLKLFLLASLILFIGELNAQLVINEVQTANAATLADEDADYGDWVELYNPSTSPISLQGYAISDNPNDPQKWNLPLANLQAGEHKVVFLSGKDRSQANPIHHYETPFYPWSTFRYLVPTEEPDPAWRYPGFDDSDWEEGTGSIGYGDGDDGTDLGGNIISVYSRFSVYLSNPNAVQQLLFIADYDDGFVAYLNGVEIARVGVDPFPAFDALATIDHEANAYQGGDYDFFIIDPGIFQSALVEGENVFSFQVHNVTPESSDLTGNFLAAFGMNDPAIQTELAPEWTNLVPEQPNWHSNFKLTSGEHLYLSQDGTILHDLIIPDLQMAYVYQRSSDGNLNWCISNLPTPQQINGGDCFTAYATEPIFSIESGVFGGPIQVTISSPIPGAQIRVTIDGSIPTESSFPYTGVLNVDQSVTIAARCYVPGLWPSAVEKNTYIVNEASIDLPIVSLSINPEYLYDELTGIYSFGPPDYDPGVPFFGANFWEDWEREGYVEYYDADHVLQFEGGVGVRIHGGWSRANPQKSLRIQCKDEYGFHSMDYPLIDDKPFIESFQGFNLRNGGNDYYWYRFHDALMQRTMRETNVDYMAYTPVIVFLNGEYWGFMEMREILDENWVEQNHGIDNDMATVISYKGGINVVNGSDASFWPMFDYITNTDPNDPSFFETVSTMLDIENYADYIIAETYWCNGDWSSGWSNNTKFWHNDNPGGKWRFMLMDMDFGMGLAGSSPNDNFITQAGDDWFHPDQIFNRMIQNAEFKKYFITRYADLINTAFQPEYVNALANEMREEVAPVMERHGLLWGTDYNALYWGLDSRLNWNVDRVPGARNVIQNHFALTNQVSLSFDMVPAGAGRVHINTIEPKEEDYPWTGVYYNGVPVKITIIENPGYHFDHWGANELFPGPSSLRQFTLNFENSASFVAYFTGEPATTPVTVSEFMYNDDPTNDSGDWIEFHNELDVPLNLSSVVVKDDNYFNRFKIPVNTVLAPGEHAVLVQDTALFNAQYGDVRIIGQLPYSLRNSNDAIRVYNYRGEEWVNIPYVDESPWPGNSDGTGRSVEWMEEAVNQALAFNWFSGCPDGSPGEPYDPLCGQVSVIEQDPQTEGSMYPNPANTEVWLEMNNHVQEVTITNALGAIVWKTTQENTSKLSFDVSSWSAGAYTVKAIDTAGKMLVERLIVR